MHILNTETIYISVLENNPNYYICLSAQIPTYRGQKQLYSVPWNRAAGAFLLVI